VIQVYFLSILCNALTGFVLLSDGLERSNVSKDLFKNPSFRLCLGLAALIIGCLKLLSPVPGNYPVVGDILPSLGGLLAGGSLIYEFYKAHSTVSSPTSEGISNFISLRKNIIGIAAIGTAFLHFLLPTALFL
jgi:hypothetical protein